MIRRLLDGLAAGCALALLAVSVGILLAPVDHTPAYVDLAPRAVAAP